MGWWNTFWNTLSPSMGIGALSGLAILFIGKNFVTKGIETSLNKNLEKYKKELEKKAFEYQTIFSALHKERADIIKKLYENICDIETDLNSYILHPTLGQEFFDSTNDKVKKIKSDFMRNELYFDDAFCHEIQKLLDVLNKAAFFSEVSISEGVQFCSNDPEGKLYVKDSLRESAQTAIYNTIPTLKGQLKTEFRKLLGVIS